MVKNIVSKRIPLTFEGRAGVVSHKLRYNIQSHSPAHKLDGKLEESPEMLDFKLGRNVYPNSHHMNGVSKTTDARVSH